MAHDVLRVALGLSSIEYRDLLDDIISRLDESDLEAIDDEISERVAEKMDESLDDELKERVASFRLTANEIVADCLKKITRPTQYTVVESTDRVELAKQVSDYIDVKWIPHGSLVIVPYDGAFYYCQAMVTYEK